MVEHQVVDILKTFSTEEVKQFRRFLASPYFIRSETVNSLFELLIKFHPNFISKKLTKEFIGENLFSSEKYSDSSVRNALSDLLESCELFLMQENFRKSATFSFDYLLKELREKRLVNVFSKNSAEVEKKLSPVEDVDSEYYLSKYKFELNKFNFSSINEKVVDGSVIDSHFAEIYNSGLFITVHYIIEIVSIYLTSIFYSLQYNRSVTNNFLGELIGTLNITGLEKLIEKNEHGFLVKIYIALLNTFSDMDNEAAYLNYKNVFKSNIDKLGKDEIWFHYSNLINYCMLKNRSLDGKDFYSNELFTHYEEILENEYYKNKKNEHLRFELYRDILIICLQQKRIKWVENFILTYSSKLHKSDKDNMMNLAYAYLYYEKGEYMQSWKYFNKIKIDFFLYKYDVKSYALKIYFELGYYEEALTLIENYKKFLDRNDLLSDADKNKKKNFISYLSKLILFKVGQIPHKQFSTYFRRLSLVSEVMSKNWILEKFDEQANIFRQSKRAKSA